MSKKKRRRSGERINNGSSNNAMNNSPFGINPAQLMSMLGGNLDMGQIGNMLSSMNGDGLDLNNFNLGHLVGNSQGGNSVPNNRNGFDLGALQGLMNNLGMGGFNLPNNNLNSEVDLNIANEKEDDLEDDLLYDDENIQMLIAIKSIVDSKKGKFIDKVIEAYNNGSFK